jgi:8-oxo-dGTP diphosphatase
MVAAGSALIEAAGGVLWRPAQGGIGVEIALVHRPKYDDWSVPKGKLRFDEHPLLGALREISEETSFTGQPGRMLGEISYLKDGSPKRVRYWAVKAVAGEFVSGEEVDQLIWLPPQEALAHLTPDRDPPIVQSFAMNARPTVTCVVVRHGSAGQRETWLGDDRERPLDELGHRQAEVLAGVLEAFDVQRVLSADVLRCLDTVGPFAANRGIMIESEPLLSESGYDSAPQAAEARLLSVLTAGERVVVCGQGKSIPPLLRGVCEVLNAPPWNSSTPKGAFVALHFDAENPRELVAIDEYPPVG